MRLLYDRAFININITQQRKPMMSQFDTQQRKPMMSQFDDQLIISYSKTITGFKKSEFHNPLFDLITLMVRHTLSFLSSSRITLHYITFFNVA